MIVTGGGVLFVDLDDTLRKGKTALGHYVNHPDDVEVYPEALAALTAWRAAGGWTVGVTNQGGVGDGHLSAAMHDAICARTMERCAGQLDHLVACIHPTDAGCWCRKPAPGLIYEALGEYPGPLLPRREMCLMVGDRPEDQAVALAAGIPFLDALRWRAGLDPDPDDHTGEPGHAQP